MAAVTFDDPEQGVVGLGWAKQFSVSPFLVAAGDSGHLHVRNTEIGGIISILEFFVL
jgi:hypothetical protein